MTRKSLDNILDRFENINSEEMSNNGISIANLQNRIKELESGASSVFLDVNCISRSPYQPRKHFDSLRQADLNESVKLYGITQNIIVRQIGDLQYELIAGERRLIAAFANNFDLIPAKVLNLSDCDARALAMAENLQRENLNVYEETRAVVFLIGSHLEIDSIFEIKTLISNLENSARSSKRRGDSEVPTDPQRSIVEDIIGKYLKGMAIASFKKHRLPLLDLPSDVIIAIENGLSHSKALAVSKVKDLEARADLIRVVSDDNFSMVDVNKMIKNVLNESLTDKKLISTESTKLFSQQSRFNLISRKVKSMKDFSRLDEMEILLNQMEALIS